MVLNAEEKLKKAIIKLQGRNPFFSYLALYLKFQKAKKGDLPDYAGMGVASDGTLVYSEEFVDKLTDEEIIGVLCHEVLHLALIHLLRRRTREPTKWNIGCDLAVNTILKKNGFKLPIGSLEADDNDCFEIVGKHGLKKVEHISDKTAEELYDLLPDLKEKYVNGYDGKGNYGFDEHKEGTAKTQGEKQKQENEWLKRIEEAYTSSKMRGQQPCGLERYIEELKKSQINWRALLQKYLQASIVTDYSWCLEKNTPILSSSGKYMPIKNITQGRKVLGYKNGKIVFSKVKSKFQSKVKEKYIIITKKGRKIICSGEHKFLTKKGYVKARDLNVKDKVRCI